MERFVRESRVTARLQHPNIVPGLDSGAVTGPDGVALPWYAMAYVPGEWRYSPPQDLHFQRFLAILIAPRPAAPGGC